MNVFNPLADNLEAMFPAAFAQPTQHELPGLLPQGNDQPMIPQFSAMRQE